MAEKTRTILSKELRKAQIVECTDGIDIDMLQGMPYTLNKIKLDFIESRFNIS